MSENIFCKNFFIIQYILKIKINIIILVGAYITKYGFTNKKFVKIVC